MKKPIDLHETAPHDELAWPDEPNNLSINSPATLFFTDFKQSKPLTMPSETLAIDALKVMEKSHEQLAMVVNKENHFIGLIDIDALTESSFVHKISEGQKRTEITVSDFMFEREKIKAIDFSSIEDATIEDVINLLHKNHQKYCLLLDEESHLIRGVISDQHVSHKLNLKLSEEASFLAIFKAIQNHADNHAIH